MPSGRKGQRMSELFKGVICPSDIGLNENCNTQLSCITCFEKSLEEHDAKVRTDAIEEFKTDIINKIDFEDKWLFDCKSNNADTNIAFSALKTFIENRAEQLKEQIQKGENV